MSERFAVMVAVSRPDGSVEHVRVGTAVKSADGFTVNFDSMNLRPEAAGRSAAAPRAASRPASGGGSSDMVFPPYGRSKGMPVSGASLQDLEFYANGCRRTLNDPGKARWHDKERVLLAAIEAEINRQRGGASDAGDDFGGGGGSMGDDGVPPPGDEDAPF